jgi:hypothetical protein
LAARGYWQAFQKVKEKIDEAITGGDAGALARTTHKEWSGNPSGGAFGVPWLHPKANAFLKLFDDLAPRAGSHRMSNVYDRACFPVELNHAFSPFALSTESPHNSPDAIL